MSFPQDHNQQYHPILGPDRQLHSNQPPDQPIDTSNLDFCRVLYGITPENNSSTPGIDLEAKPGDLVAVVNKSAPTGDVSESWLCRAHDGRQGFLPLTSREIVRKGAQPQAQIRDGVMANTLTTLAATRTNLLSSNVVKQLDHSSQKGLSIRDYLSNLDFDGSEQDAGHWSEENSQQASVSESLAPSRRDGCDPSQPSDDRIVESQSQDMMKKQNWQAIPEEAKRHMMAHSTALTKSTSVERRMIPQNLSFYVRIQPLSPHNGVHGQPIRHSELDDWLPPNRPYGIIYGQGPILLLRWAGGRVITVPPNNQIQAINLDGYLHRAATIFTQHPDAPHLLAVPFDARTRSVHLFGRSWQRIAFNHNRIGNSNSIAYYSYISDQGAEPRIAAPGLPHWIPQLLPAWYDCDARHAPRTQAGLIGKLTILFALAAISAPLQSRETPLSSMQPGKWMHHKLTTGRKLEPFAKQMMLTVCRQRRAWHGSHSLPRSTESSMVYSATT